jgi:hypothetical protein
MQIVLFRFFVFPELYLRNDFLFRSHHPDTAGSWVRKSCFVAMAEGKSDERNPFSFFSQVMVRIKLVI